MSTRVRTSPALRISRGIVIFVYGFAIVCSVILAMAFFLELFNANESTPFVDWVFRATERIMQPFRGIFPSIEGQHGSVFDPALLFAIFIYWLLAIGMQALVGWIDRKIVAQRAAAEWEAKHQPPPPTRPAAVPYASVPPATTPPPSP
jgi:uncharacterized protein YggT (Ycf19 family)